ncbi:ribonuclease BN (tRNA processing enzyme) [Duganella sp. 1224]|uniref:MBL fold metallo-hydrolase n=1 Tax=Duganella sp. 1224 TaxID=2587052 RepID=UPI0017FCEE95|nr:MBL fold metallo-hydrolase [Duganella sp. 1224]NYE61125.1 ribonuclease BN (tRNA processing enzyme) [Duganella sp. 1224]
MMRRLAAAVLMLACGMAQAQVPAPGESTPAPPPAVASAPTTAQAAPSAASAPALELLVLGSGGPGAVGRASSSFVVLLDGQPRILVDAGPGSFARAGEARLHMQAMDIVLLTHLHIDHAGELPGILLGRAVSTGRPLDARIFGPGGAGQFPSTRRFVDLNFGPKGAYAYLKDFSAPLHYSARDIPARPIKPQVLLTEDGLTITAIPGHHRDAPAVIYRVDYKGHSITFSGDIDAHGLPALAQLAQGTDLLVFNSVVLDPPGSAPQLYELHTPPAAIGKLAAQAHAGRVLLTHISPLVEQQQDAVLASIRQAYAGPVALSADLTRVPVTGF